MKLNSWTLSIDQTFPPLNKAGVDLHQWIVTPGLGSNCFVHWQNTTVKRIYIKVDRGWGGIIIVHTNKCMTSHWNQAIKLCTHTYTINFAPSIIKRATNWRELLPSTPQRSSLELECSQSAAVEAQPCPAQKGRLETRGVTNSIACVAVTTYTYTRSLTLSHNDKKYLH